jgi:hypothetical protein
MDEELSSPDTSDSLTAEEQLAAMLNRNKLRAKVKENSGSHKSVSIEMEGDNFKFTYHLIIMSTRWAGMC